MGKFRWAIHTTLLSKKILFRYIKVEWGGWVGGCRWLLAESGRGEVIVIHLSEKAAEADETKFCSDFEDLSIIPAAHPPICGAWGSLRFLDWGASWFKAAAEACAASPPLDNEKAEGSLWKVEEATAGIVVAEVSVVVLVVGVE